MTPASDDSTENAVDQEPQWPHAGSLPMARADLSAVPLDDNVAIYDEVGRTLVMLNSSAAAVLERCDGATPFADMVAELAQEHGEDASGISEDVWRTVRKLASMGLVQDAR